jgi:protein-S-isoprenylcysteine O-methyltransferase Ste14
LRKSFAHLAALGGGRLTALRRTKLYDLLVALPLIAWFAFSALEMLPTLVQQITLIKLFIETDPSVLPATLVLTLGSKVAIFSFLTILVVLFAVRYVPQARASGLYPCFASIGGTFLGVGIALLPPQELSTTVYIASLLLTVGGFTIAIWAALSLGRSISMLPEARQLVTRGAYSSLRHPIYLGEMVGLAGVALQYRAPWALLLLALQFIFQFMRINYEERILLGVFPEYAAYAARTARLVPGVY